VGNAFKFTTPVPPFSEGAAKNHVQSVAISDNLADKAAGRIIVGQTIGSLARSKSIKVTDGNALNVQIISGLDWEIIRVSTIDLLSERSRELELS
jgi:hypothetical protein